MELQRDAVLGFVIVLSTLILTCFGSIALLGRMGPAIGEVLGDNMVSVMAAEEMMSIVAGESSGYTTGQVKRFETALATIRKNVTEVEEGPLVAIIEDGWPRLRRADPGAQDRVVRALHQLISINHNAMVAGDGRARRLASAGQWAVVLLGSASFVASLLSIRRTRKRVLEPIAELHGVMLAMAAGETQRRCRRMDAPAELLFLRNQINEMLDARYLPTRSAASYDREHDPQRDRALLAYLLDQRSEPTAVVTERSIQLANQPGLELLAGTDGEAIKTALLAVPAGERFEPVREITRIESANYWLCSFGELPGSASPS